MCSVMVIILLQVYLNEISDSADIEDLVNDKSDRKEKDKIKYFDGCTGITHSQLSTGDI